MPQVTIDEFLTVLAQSKGTIFLALTTKTRKLPGEGGLNKFKRGDKGTPTPFVDGIDHLIRQRIILGADYETMVNRQRGRELDAYIDSLPKPPKFVEPPPTPVAETFIAEALWRGKGGRDELFPKFVAIHTGTEERYLCFRPCSEDEDGKPTPLVSEYYDVTTGRKLDFKTELADFYKPESGPPKSQMTEKMIAWQTVKLKNILSAKHKGELYDIIPAREVAGI